MVNFQRALFLKQEAKLNSASKKAFVPSDVAIVFTDSRNETHRSYTKE